MFEEIESWLQRFVHDPVQFLPIFFFVTILTTIILPLPIESIMIFAMTSISFPLLAITLGLGKCVGSLFVFFVGAKLEPKIRRWSAKWKFFARFMAFSEGLVAKYRYYALFLLLSIPFMLDTVILYLFSLLNKDGKELNVKWFAITNFLGGVTRACVVGLIFIAFGIELA